MANGCDSPLAIPEPKHLSPRLAIVVACQRDDAMLREILASDEKAEQFRQVHEMPGDQDVPRFTAYTIPDPLRRIIGLQIARRGKLREWIARPPERFGCLLRAELATVPHCGRSHPSRCSVRRQALCYGAALV